MIDNRNPQAILASRRELIKGKSVEGVKTCEGGCGVIGIIGTIALPGRLIIRSCEQMRNRGNGKGGGVAAVGVFPEEFKEHYALHIAYLDENVRADVEKSFVEPQFEVAHSEWQPQLDDYREAGLEIKPPRVHRYFVTPKPERVEQLRQSYDFQGYQAAADEFVYQNSFSLNYKFYANAKHPHAFVLSHGRDLMILKAVGFAEEVARYYQLEGVRAHTWIGHQRFPTRGRVWHPGGAHPFVGLHEALVHNGDFANYHSVAEYLYQQGLLPLFITDTEVSALLFDFYSRVLGYPLEYVIEALASTPEGDFNRLTKRRQRIYRALQTAHIHGSPDGPWFFIITRAERSTGLPQLIGITDVSMLRPQVFAAQWGSEKSFGAIASEKQAIDAFFADLSELYPDVPPVADKYWNARGGSFSDGGAFAFTLVRTNKEFALEVRDKFENIVREEGKPENAGETTHPIAFVEAFHSGPARLIDMTGANVVPFSDSDSAKRLARKGVGLNSESLDGDEKQATLAENTEAEDIACSLKELLQRKRLTDFSAATKRAAAGIDPLAVISVLSHLRDKHWDPGQMKRSHAVAIIEREIAGLLDSLPRITNGSSSRLGEAPLIVRLGFNDNWDFLSEMNPPLGAVLVIDGRGFAPEGETALCRKIVYGYECGFRQFIPYRLHGDRFIGCGLGPDTTGVRIDVYGSSGDYLGSGLDGAEIYVHGNAQDQVGQILKSGKIIIYGDVGQTFLYGAKGGETFVRGNAAGRPLINAVGKIRAVINGTCLDYCAESFMAGRDTGDGFVIINGITFDNHGEVIGLQHKYPGNNLFSLASGGSCYLNDPYHTVKDSQLNGAEFVPFHQNDWNVIAQYLQYNEMLFGMSIRRDLLLIDGVLRWPKEVFRKIVASHQKSKLDWSSLPD